MKRFTETTKWDDPWFLDLSICAKLMWIYLVDKCDNAGVVDIHNRKASFETGLKLEEVAVALEELSMKLGSTDSGKTIVRGFIEFQFGELKENSNLHKSVLALLKKHGMANPSSTHQVPIAMGPSKGKGMVKVEVKEKVEANAQGVCPDCNGPLHVSKWKDGDIVTCIRGCMDKPVTTPQQTPVSIPDTRWKPDKLVLESLMAGIKSRYNRSVPDMAGYISVLRSKLEEYEQFDIERLCGWLGERDWSGDNGKYTAQFGNPAELSRSWEKLMAKLNAEQPKESSLDPEIEKMVKEARGW